MKYDTIDRPKTKGGRELLLPIDETMPINGSFIYGDYSEYLMASILSRLGRWAVRRNLKWKFSARKTEEGKMRFWRIK